jgi:hypothetical protein
MAAIPDDTAEADRGGGGRGSAVAQRRLMRRECMAEVWRCGTEGEIQRVYQRTVASARPAAPSGPREQVTCPIHDRLECAALQPQHHRRSDGNISTYSPRRSLHSVVAATPFGTPFGEEASRGEVNRTWGSKPTLRRRHTRTAPRVTKHRRQKGTFGWLLLLLSPAVKSSSR